ncbi:penicillin-binding protein 2 [Blastomonas sp.]|uniref:penicillin-binding protein 2 n=1 Tax=Blastomonas sp. TaxID=1909299 RepID=UPI00359485D4
MKHDRQIVTEAVQAMSFSRRSFVLGAGQLAVGGLLVTRMGYLAIAENEKYQLLSESNRVNLSLVPPPRGWIIDRRGEELAGNRPDYRIDVIPGRLADPDRTLAELNRFLALGPDELKRVRDEIAQSKGLQPVQIADQLSQEQYLAISVRQADWPGVVPSQVVSRYYADGAAVGHLLGYVGIANAEEYEKSKDPVLITPGYKIGKQGLEQELEQRLRGRPGARRTEVTARGKVVRDLASRPVTPGQTVQLTIDRGLQHYAARRCGPDSAAVTVLDTVTGGILAMVSMPSFDPNSFSDGISHDEWDMLSKDDHLPLLNKSLQGLYPPGSTIKPAVALALLESGIAATERVTCPGRVYMAGRFFHCWRRGGHGSVDMRRAVAQSCDVYFYTMAARIGMEKLAATYRMLGLGEEFDLPTPHQRYGTVPDPAWLKRKYNRKWTLADTLNASIGQGYMLSNPLQLATLSARIASGRAVTPQLLASTSAPQAAPLPVQPEHLQIVREGMWGVVNGAGTAGRSRLPVEGVEMAGKTGTAQVVNITRADRARGGSFGGRGVPWKYRDHALFVAFAPTDQPRYAASTIVEHGISGSGAAAPIASDTLLYLYDPAKALAKLEALEEGWGGGIQERADAAMTAFQVRSADSVPATTGSAAGATPE